MNATLSYLGNPHNTQIKAAITEKYVFINSSVTIQGINLISTRMKQWHQQDS